MRRRGRRRASAHSSSTKRISLLIAVPSSSARASSAPASGSAVSTANRRSRVVAGAAGELTDGRELPHQRGEPGGVQVGEAPTVALGHGMRAGRGIVEQGLDARRPGAVDERLDVPRDVRSRQVRVGNSHASEVTGARRSVAARVDIPRRLTVPVLVETTFRVFLYTLVAATSPLALGATLAVLRSQRASHQRPGLRDGLRRRPDGGVPARRSCSSRVTVRARRRPHTFGSGARAPVRHHVACAAGTSGNARGIPTKRGRWALARSAMLDRLEQLSLPAALGTGIALGYRRPEAARRDHRRRGDDLGRRPRARPGDQPGCALRADGHGAGVGTCRALRGVRRAFVRHDDHRAGMGARARSSR